MPKTLKQTLSAMNFPFREKAKERNRQSDKHFTAGMQVIRSNLVGQHAMITGPYGERLLTYADYAASGRKLYMIENYLAKYVYGYYGNTHTTTSFNALQTTKFRGDAKTIVRQCCNANDQDAVIFCGSGATAAIHKLIGVLGMSNASAGCSSVVFIGPYEHHSNILPWKETGAKIVRIRENRHGLLDEGQLEQELSEHNAHLWKFKIGTFSACSNVTGLLADTNRISQLMHKYGGLVFWDYAAGAPYLDIDMNPPMDTYTTVSAHKDAMFCSPHKFVGGPGSPGVLIAKKKLFTNHIPHSSGGGTVVYVTSNNHSYVKDIETREEGGTPAIIESIRAGLAFQLKHSIGVEAIRKREEYLTKLSISALQNNSNIILLGSKISARLPILSFCVKHNASKKLLHHNFIAMILNQVFGIQVRGGCACAGPYAHDLLGIADEISNDILALLDDDIKHKPMVKNDGSKDLSSQEMKSAKSLGIMKPGFVRVSLPYFMTDDEVNFILSAINMVADEAWKLLPQYSYTVESGHWEHKCYKKRLSPLMSLADISYERTEDFRMTVQGFINPKSSFGKQQSFGYILKEAQKIFSSAPSMATSHQSVTGSVVAAYLPESMLGLIWWLEPHQAVMLMNSQSPDTLEMQRSWSVIPIKLRQVSGPVNTVNQAPSTSIQSKHQVNLTPTTSSGSNLKRLSKVFNKKIKKRQKLNHQAQTEVDGDMITHDGRKKPSRNDSNQTAVKEERTRQWLLDNSEWKIDNMNETSTPGDFTKHHASKRNMPMPSTHTKSLRGGRGADGKRSKNRMK